MTSSISAISSLLGTATTSSAQSMPSWSDVRTGVLSAVSSELGMSQTDLTTQLKAGKSMADIATAAGVSTQDLISTIQTSLGQSGLPSGIDFSAMATRMANNVNNASIDDDPTSTTGSTSTSSGSSSTGSSLGIDTSSVSDSDVGGLSLDADEVSMLLGSSGQNLDTYL